MKYIITGIGSGLGKYLHRNIPNSLGIDRININQVLPQIEEDDIIIHCAFNNAINIKDHRVYLEDNIFLTKKLHMLRNRLIYISSVDIYLQKNSYSLFKQFGESIVSSTMENLILRCSALIGPDMRPNHITKMMSNSNEKLSLAGTSSFNYIHYNDILKFITSDKCKTINGVYDFTSSDTISLNYIKDSFNLKVEFGNYEYTTPNVFTHPIQSVYPLMIKSSLDTLKDWIL